MSKIRYSLVLFCLVWLIGCGRPQQVVSSDQVCLKFTGEQTMEAAKSVLQSMHFSLEKDDPQASYLRTRPLAGAQFFQFWRQDNADAYMTSQANLHSLRRTVEMEFYPQGDTVCMNCRVQVQRLSLPEQPVEGYLNFAGSFTESEQSRQTVQVDKDRLEAMEWLDAGLDRALEQKILKKVQKKLQKGSVK